VLEFYAGYTGGAFFGHTKKKTLEDQLSRMAAEINSQYELAYVPGALNQPGFHRIEVQVRRPGVKVRARAGYFYQPPKP
jgi:VWFA-related protein